MSSAPSFVITTRFAGGSRSQVWHSSQPLTIGHPFQWVIEKTPEGVRVRNIASRLDEITKGSFQELSRAMIEKGDSIELPTPHGEQKLTVEIRPMRELKAPFDLKPSKEGVLRAYSCIGNWVLSSAPVGDLYAGHAHGERVFLIRKDSSGYRIEPLVDGLSLGNKALTTGQATHVNSDRLSSEIIAFNSLLWRFNSAAVPAMPTTVGGTEDLESLWFRKSLRNTGLALGAFFLLTLFWPKPEPKEMELIPPQFTKIVLSKPQKSTAAAAAPAASAAPKDTARRAQDAKVVQAFRAQALQSAVSGLLKGGMTSLLAQSDFVSGKKATDQARAMFDKKSGALTATAPANGLVKGREVAVSEMGGTGAAGGKGVGYGKGENARVGGQGKSLVSLDTGGSEVEQGLTKDEVGEVIHRHMSEVRYCYESAMLRTPDIEGKLIMNFTIGGAGKVKTASIKQSTLPDPRLDDCILRRLMTWKFPQPKGGIDVAVSYPFIFKTLGR